MHLHDHAAATSHHKSHFLTSCHTSATLPLTTDHHLLWVKLAPRTPLQRHPILVSNLIQKHTILGQIFFYTIRGEVILLTSSTTKSRHATLNHLLCTVKVNPIHTAPQTQVLSHLQLLLRPRMIMAFQLQKIGMRTNITNMSRLYRHRLRSNGGPETKKPGVLPHKSRLSSAGKC